MEILVAAAYGLVFGSFYNVCICRYLSGESVAWPPSHCPHCEHKLAWYDLIPLLSYLLLKGRCRYCGRPISPQYPCIEVVTALVYGVLFWKFGFSGEFLVYAIFFGLLIVLSGIDARVMLLPDKFTLPGTALAIPASVFLLGHGWYDVLLGAGMGYGGFWLIAKFMELRGKEGLGYGDAKLMAMLGALSGFQAVPCIQLCAVISAFLFAISTRKTNSPFAFGPWLCLGFLMQLLTDVRISV